MNSGEVNLYLTGAEHTVYIGDTAYCYYFDEISQIFSDHIHNFSGTPSGERAATCTEDGYTGDRYCSICHTTFEGKVISKLGHNFVVSGTYLDILDGGHGEGTKTYTCTRCKESYTENLYQDLYGPFIVMSSHPPKKL